MDSNLTKFKRIDNIEFQRKKEEIDHRLSELKKSEEELARQKNVFVSSVKAHFRVKILFDQFRTKSGSGRERNEKERQTLQTVASRL